MDTKPRIDYIRVKWVIDESPDVSYLESTLSEDGKTIISSCRYTQEELDKHPIRTRRYIREDMGRLEKFNSGELQSYGCIAEAEISYPLTDDNRRIEWLTSGGVWGIESDTNREYREIIADEQLDDLKGHCERLNVDTPRRRWVNGDYWEDLKKEAIDRMDNTEERKDSNLSVWVKVGD